MIVIRTSKDKQMKSLQSVRVRMQNLTIISDLAP
jgi:hypothetical protein